MRSLMAQNISLKIQGVILAEFFNYILKTVTTSLIGLAIKAWKDSSIFLSAILKDIKTVIG